MGARAGHVEVVATLLGVQHLHVASRDSDGATPLLLATEAGHARVALLLLAPPVGESMRSRPRHSGATPAHLAGTAEMLDLLASEQQQGVSSVPATTRFGDTPLHHAAWAERLEVVDVLLARGLSPTDESDDKSTPLSLARHQGEHGDVYLKLRAVAQARHTDVSVTIAHEDDDSPVEFGQIQDGNRSVALPGSWIEAARKLSPLEQRAIVFDEFVDTEDLLSETLFDAELDTYRAANYALKFA